MTVRSKGSWGREPYKTDEELDRLAKAFFAEVKVPPEWKFKGYDKCLDLGIKTDLHPNGTITSVGAVFLDKRTSGLNLKHYKVLFFTFSCMGGLVEKSNAGLGKFKYSCVTFNQTIEKLNKYIADNYKELGAELKKEANDTDDGLQHFRDRFGT